MKILGEGDLERKLTVKVNFYSKTAQEKIEQGHLAALKPAFAAGTGTLSLALVSSAGCLAVAGRVASASSPVFASGAFSRKSLPSMFPC